MSFYHKTDMLGRIVKLKLPPQRIISLVPSQTELLFNLGLGKHIIGRTKFCIHPIKQVKSVKNIGGTKKLHFDKINQLQPDLIIANKEENNKEDVAQLEKDYPVWVSDINDLSTACKMIERIGELCNKKNEAVKISADIQASFNQLKAFKPITALYFIWRKPFMLAGKDTFINQMMEKSGFENAISKNRYPEMNVEELCQFNPDLILLSSEPYPFKPIHIAEIQAIFPQSQIKLVDGELFSWYGSRLLKSATYFKELRENIDFS